MERVHLMSHKDRPSFAITILMSNGTRYVDEFHSAELKWDLATETRRIDAFLDGIAWLRERLDSIVQTVPSLEGQTSV